MKSLRVQVTTAKTMVVGGRADDPMISLGGSVGYATAAIIRNLSSGQTVYIGGPDVDTTQGFPLAAGEDLEVDIVGDIIYGVTSTTSCYLYIFRRGS